ncbi:MAG: response regulator transcription factor [Caldilineaceae bacterium]|nr:response regulator transcription factor [Caldilineaceae bacterium]
MSIEQIDIYVLEEHPIIREVLCEMLNLLPTMQVSGSAGNAADVLNQLPATKVDILLVDGDLHTTNSLDFIRQVRRQWPQLPLLVLSSHDNGALVRQLLAMGVGGVLLKYASRELEIAIRQVSSGQIYLSSQLTQRHPVAS